MDLIGRFFMSKEKIQGLKNLLAKYNELEDYQKENLKRVMLELSMIAAFTIIALALNSGDDDEEDYFRDLLAYQSNRVLLEVSSFYNPTELISAIKDPIVPARDLELVTNFTDMFNTKEIESGKWEGMTKQQKYLLQLVPGIKGYTTLADPDSQNNFLKNKNLKPTYSAYEFFFEEEKE
jgi:citrate synthase